MKGFTFENESWMAKKANSKHLIRYNLNEKKYTEIASEKRKQK